MDILDDISPIYFILSTRMLLHYFLGIAVINMTIFSCGMFGCVSNIEKNGTHLVVKMFKSDTLFHKEDDIIKSIKEYIYESNNVSDDTKQAFERCTCIPGNNTPELIDADLEPLRDYVNRLMYAKRNTPRKYIVYTTFPISTDLLNLAVIVDTRYIDQTNKFIRASNFNAFRDDPDFYKVYYDIIESYTSTLDIMQTVDIFHTDVKLDNIIIGFEKGVYQGVKVIDFGVDFEEGTRTGMTRVNKSTYFQWSDSEKQNLHRIASKLGYGEDPSKSFLLSNWGQTSYEFENATQRAHYDVLFCLQQLTSNITYKTDFLFKPQMSTKLGFATFVELSEIVFLQWCITPPKRCGPSQFIKTATDALKRIVKPMTKLPKLEAISAAVYEMCPPFLKRILKILAPIVMERVSVRLQERDEWVNKFDPKSVIPVLRSYNGGNPVYDIYPEDLKYPENGDDDFTDFDDGKYFSYRCLFELVISQVTYHESAVLKHVVSEVSAPSSIEIASLTASSLSPEKRKFKLIDGIHPWRGGNSYSLQSARTDGESRQNKTFVFSFVGVCVCILCSVLSSSVI